MSEPLICYLFWPLLTGWVLCKESPVFFSREYLLVPVNVVQRGHSREPVFLEKINTPFVFGLVC